MQLTKNNSVCITLKFLFRQKRFFLKTLLNGPNMFVVLLKSFMIWVWMNKGILQRLQETGKYQNCLKRSTYFYLRNVNFKNTAKVDPWKWLLKIQNWLEWMFGDFFNRSPGLGYRGLKMYVKKWLIFLYEKFNFLSKTT